MTSKVEMFAEQTLKSQKLKWDNYILPVRITVWTWKICALYNEQPQGLFYRAYRYIFNFVLMAVYLFALVLNMFVMQTFEQLVLYIMYIVFTEVVMVLKALITYYKFDQICRLYQLTLGENFKPQDDLETELHRKVHSTCCCSLFVFICFIQLSLYDRMLREVEKLYSPAFFAQFSASGLVICATAFNLSELTAIQNLLYMIAMMFQMYLPCHFGNEVTRKSNVLKTAVYSSQWYNMHLKDRKIILMLLQRLNKPFTLTAYHFFNYNLQAYTTVR
ncbi:uncharacterized protein LOC125950959 [Anopheles darlingi]|uniref:uncharacterized protein LOC125950959 n=1 Tax=Anopheles darlingi TaxID=43151 RepID=UPI0020FFF7F7|nr:uncharacterized protein LOC125950959 [Anopheles darlingi]